MNRITGMVLVALGLGLVVLDQAASAQSNCKDAKGFFVEFWDGGNDIPGTISNGGWLNGAARVVITSAGYPTPVPTAFTYIGAFTLTTGHGQLNGTRLFLTDVGTGWSTDMTNIDPNASTGIFAGATGVLYVNAIKSNTAPPPTTFESEVKGRICFAAP
jgi:hypothetical protein